MIRLQEPNLHFEYMDTNLETIYLGMLNKLLDKDKIKNKIIKIKKEEEKKGKKRNVQLLKIINKLAAQSDPKSELERRLNSLLEENLGDKIFDFFFF